MRTFALSPTDILPPNVVDPAVLKVDPIVTGPAIDDDENNVVMPVTEAAEPILENERTLIALPTFALDTILAAAIVASRTIP